MNTKVEEALDVVRDGHWPYGKTEQASEAIRTIADYLAQQDATIARLTAALATIRDSTFRNATTLRGMADYTLNQEKSP